MYLSNGTLQETRDLLCTSQGRLLKKIILFALNKYLFYIYIKCGLSVIHFTSKLGRVNMTFCCLPSGLPNITLRNIFRRIRCVSACCGRKIVIQLSELDGGTVPPRSVLQPRESSKFWRWRCCLPQSKK